MSNLKTSSCFEVCIYPLIEMRVFFWTEVYFAQVALHGVLSIFAFPVQLSISTFTTYITGPILPTCWKASQCHMHISQHMPFSVT